MGRACGPEIKSPTVLSFDSTRRGGRRGSGWVFPGPGRRWGGESTTPARRDGRETSPHHQPALDGGRLATGASAGGKATGSPFGSAFSSPGSRDRRRGECAAHRRRSAASRRVFHSSARLYLLSRYLDLVLYLYVVLRFQRKISGLSPAVSAENQRSESCGFSGENGLDEQGGCGREVFQPSSRSRRTGAIRGGVGCSSRQPGGVR